MELNTLAKTQCNQESSKELIPINDKIPLQPVLPHGSLTLTLGTFGRAGCTEQFYTVLSAKCG